MKQTMKHLVSFIALIAMMVSLCSAMVFPAAAAADEYDTLLNTAFVVDPDWSGKKEGTPISFVFRGKTIEDILDKDFYFASFEEAWARAKALNLANPVILLTEGVYTNEIKLDGGVTLLGPNAGTTPNVQSTDKKAIWTKADRKNEAVLSCNISVTQSAGNGNITIDGLTFGAGSAYLDYLRTAGSSELNIKNTVFETNGNSSSNNYVLFMRSEGHSRTLRMQNIYVSGYGEGLASGQTARSFIAPYFSELYVENLAYLNCPIGFLAKTWFANGVAPVIEINKSCFYNEDAATPQGYVLSIDNGAYKHDFVNTKADVNITSADGRPSSLLQVNDSVFYNASASAGVIRYEFINKNSIIGLQNNFIYSDTLTTVVVPEYLVDSAANDQTNCFIFRENVMLNTYKIPTVKGANNETYIDMSYNFFGDTKGNCIYNPVYEDAANGRMIRTAFYVDQALTLTNLDCRLTVSNWPMVWIDNDNYTIDIMAYEMDGAPFAPVFSFGDKYDAVIYEDAKVNDQGVVSSPVYPMDKIDLTKLEVNDENKATLYLHAEPKDTANNYAPFYTINIEVIGDITDCDLFETAYPEYYMYHPMAAEQASGAMMPFRWGDAIYRMTVGKNIFGSVAEIIEHAAAKGIAVPTIVVPAGVYTDEMVITGSCTILGAQHGVNPNVKPFEVIGRTDVESSAWTLNPARANDVNETVFNACLRVDSAADDYVITVDGIKMGEGCSYVDDNSRNANNVTILKNIYADNAGGGLSRDGSKNTYLFNFNKEYGVGTEYTTVYIYDTRVDNLSSVSCFGPLIEKFVVDGFYMANNTANASAKTGWAMYAFRSRDVAAPYMGFTNSYFGVAKGSGYSFQTVHHNNSNLTAMTDIVYNFDNNVFYDAFPSGGYLEFYMTGSNMTVYMQNNIIYSGHADVLFPTNRLKGDIGTIDSSNMMVIKGNHMINYACLPRTYGTANGTMWDFSGNYFADSLGVTAGLTPTQAYRISHNNAAQYTYEDVSRIKIDYTFMDWDMTQRSDDEIVMSADYTITKDPAKFVENVYTDTIAGDVTEYPRPYELGEYSVETIYLDAAKTMTASDLDVVAAMNASGDTTDVKFYIDVTSKDGSKTKSFTIHLKRTPNSESKVVAFDSAVISSGRIDVVSALSLYFLPEFVHNSGNELSLNASYEYFAKYENGVLSEPVSANDAVLAKNGSTRYLQVTSEDRKNISVYSLNVSVIKNASDVPYAYISAIPGMTKVADNRFEATVSSAQKSIVIKPEAFWGTTLKVTDASGKVIEAEGGAYTLSLANANEFSVEAVSGNGANKATYSLVFNRGKNSDASIISVNGAKKTDSGYLLPFGLSAAGTISAEVAPGATYGVYYDYGCTQKCENGVFEVKNGESGIAYLKVVSEDGSNSSIAKIVVTSQAANVNKTLLTATVGDKTYNALKTGENEYTIHLPAGVTDVKVQGKVEKASSDTFANFFGDAGYTTMIALGDDNTAKVKLDQKKTVVYVVAPATTRPGILNGAEVQVNVAEARSTLYLISDREAVTYTDASKIAKWVRPYVNYLNEGKFGIMKGDEKGNFNASKNITRYEIAAMACRVMGLDVSAFNGVTLSYADSVASWAKPYVKAVTAAGLMNGSLDARSGKISFEGSKNATREQVMKILVSVCLKTDGIYTMDGAAYYAANAGDVDMNYLAPNGTAFADEKKVSGWAKPYVRLAVGKYKMVNGELKNGSYYLNPKNNITRAEVTKMVACYMGYED